VVIILWGKQMFDDAVRLRALAGLDAVETSRDFGRELTVVRRQAGLSLRELAKAAGIPLSTVGGYFAGSHLPYVGQARVLETLLFACGVTDSAAVAQWMAAYDRARRTPGQPASTC
jgi:transcriptional regulator with XRE-family HTH domain